MNRVGLSISDSAPVSERTFREMKEANIDAIEVCSNTPYSEYV